jgi:hypothetical protein
VKEQVRLTADVADSKVDRAAERYGCGGMNVVKSFIGSVFLYPLLMQFIGKEVVTLRVAIGVSKGRSE